MTNTWSLDETLQQKFLAACKEAATNDEAFATFKENPYIGVVIENSTWEWANKIPVEFHGGTPTETRYNYTAHLIQTLVGLPLNGEIIEIGGGYGGLCKKLLIQTGQLVDYILYDPQEVQALQRVYVSDERAIFPSEIRHERPMLCIAWCSWSELTLETRKEYLEKVISKAEHIFFCVNWDYEENKAMLLEYFPDLKEYQDEHFNNIIYR